MCFWGVRRLCGARGRGREQDCSSKGRITSRRETGASREILMLLHKNALVDDDNKDKDDGRDKYKYQDKYKYEQTGASRERMPMNKNALCSNKHHFDFSQYIGVPVCKIKLPNLQ